MQTVHAEGFQFVEKHIGYGDGVDLGIEHHALHNLLALFLKSHSIDDGKHIGKFGNLTIHHTILDSVIVGFHFVAPEGLIDFMEQLLRLRTIVGLDAKHIGTKSHCFQSLAEQNLFEAESATLVHGEINPVDENPVVGLTLSHSFAVGATLYVIHQRYHAGPHLANEVCVACVLVVVKHRLKPIEGIVHDGVDMGRHGVFASQLSDGTFDTLGIEAQVIVHEIRLDSITTPRPTVALDAVHEELAGGKVHRIGSHFPYLIDFLVRATERTTMRQIVGSIFIVHQYFVINGAFFCLDIDIAEGFASEVRGLRSEV